MSETALSVVFSLSTALSTGTFSIIVRRGQSHANAVTGVLIGLIVTVPIFAALTWALWRPGWWNPEAYLLLAASGLLGPAIGRVLYFSGIHHLGVSRSLPLASTMPLVAAVLGIGILGERPGPSILAGTVLIVLGCIGITWKRAGDTSWNRRHIWIPIAAVVMFSISHVFRKTGVQMVDSPLVAITVMSASGMVCLYVIAPWLPADQRPQMDRPKAWMFYTASGILNGVSVLFHFFALNHGDLTIVTPLAATAPFFSLLLSRILLPDVERVTLPIVMGTVLVVGGGVLIALRVW